MARLEVVVVKADEPFEMAEGDEVVRTFAENRNQHGVYYHLTILRRGGD